MGAKSLSTKNLSNSERLRLQKNESRRNQRDNIFDNRRIDAVITVCNECIDSSIVEFTDDSHVTNTTTNQSNLHSTFVIPEKLSLRKKALALWRQQRIVAATRKPVENRPVLSTFRYPYKQ